jgi:microcystin-dependent protein
MANPFVAEIRIFPFNFAPTGWAMCQGQLIPISQNTALFSLLGTMYGGDGRSTFALPNLQGCAALGAGQGPGLSLYVEGQAGGSPTVTLLNTEMPAHNHGAGCYNGVGDSYTGANAIPATDAAGNNLYSTPADHTMNALAIAPTGGSLPHNNLQPYLTLNYCIALQGVFPARS